ncbi:NADPH-dependent ferric siderophore reductase, contains FAD-binding and SIP domains [Amycolatopsis arida]|uniref:NADPH-dependent ferric siderophore reductase, contains FAD-binding and SIP domains n=2 Tax=Amycolatopsis arida TaxID=587909 RepID=A0A1I5WCD4_9PSEU|nr:NADPH-dependent ferric siderophore reductase [Amycolatopsis arida]SFQ17404.1 NADPH-dependent ferric siderophore reductase, contains FAD-binding and SIP domains [Amycolatopsis arida]
MRVSHVRQLTPHMLRVGFAGDDLRSIPSGAPDQYVKLFFPRAGQPRPELPPPPDGETLSWYRTYLAMPDHVRPPMRTYTVRALRPASGELDVDFVVHADGGPGSTWATRARPGDEVALLGPHGLYAVPDGTDWQLLVGDETALPAIAAILEHLDAGTHVRVIVEVAGPADEQPLPTAGSAHVTWVHRNTDAPGRRLLAAVRNATLPGGTPYAWVSGEAGMVKLVRRHLVRERGIDKRRITFTGYWRRGVSEEDTGRESVRRGDTGQLPTAD